MKILFLLGDCGEKSLERQLAEVVEEMIGKDAEIVWYDPAQGLPAFKALDGIWIFTHEEDGGCPETLTAFLGEAGSRLDDIPLTFTGIGGKDGAMNAVTELSELLEAREARVMNEGEFVCIPLRSARLDLDQDERMDLFWHVDAFLKYCGMDDSDSRKIAFETVVSHYFKLMKHLSADGRKPTELAFDGADIVTDVGRFVFSDLTDAPEELEDLTYEIGTLTEDYEMEEDEILSALLEKILIEW